MRRFARFGAVLGIVALVAGACGDGGGDDEAEPEPTEAEEDEDLDALSADFASQLRGLAAAPSAAEAADEDVEIVDEYTDYEVLTDATGVVQVAVPVEWSDSAGDVGFVADDGSTFGAGLAASPDLAGFNETWGVPGVKVSASSTATDTLGDLLALNGEIDECTSQGVEDYADDIYSGVSEVWTDCGGTDTEWIVIAALPEDESYVVLVAFQLVSDADVEALDQVIASFEVVGALPS